MTNQEWREDQQAERISRLLDELGAVVLFQFNNEWDAHRVSIEILFPDGAMCYCQSFEGMERILRERFEDWQEQMQMHPIGHGPNDFDEEG